MAALVDTAVKYFTDGNAASNFSSAAFIRALDKTPSLAAELYAALDGKELYFREELLRIIGAAGDPAALPFLRGMRALAHWSEAVLAIDAGELADALVTKLSSFEPEDEPHLPLIAAYYAGTRARAALDPILVRAPDLVALGIALIGEPDDLAWIKALSTAGHGISAKRIHGALAKPKLKDRLAALEALLNAIGHLGTLLALCKLLADPEPPIVERAALHLRGFVRSRGSMDALLHATFLRRARAAIVDGVTSATRDALVDVQATIPQSTPFPIGSPPKKPAVVIAARAAVAEKKALGVKLRGLEMLDTLREQVAAKPATARNAALEAQIAEDPNAVAHYLVYADWLQTQNDARGLLITLQHAARESPADNARAIAANAFLHEHRYSLLGRLEPFVRERDRTIVDLDWFMGFIRRARIAGQTSQMLDAVTYLLETPSAMFLQELVVESRGGPLAIDPHRIVEMLLETKQPQTLARLSIGKPGGWTMPPALNATFPRLARDPALLWAEAMEKAAAQKKLKLDVDPARLPLLVPHKQGTTVDMSLVLLGLKAELDKQRPLGVLAAMPQVFAREVLDGFALALAEQWEAIGETPRWPFDAIGPLGGELCVAYLSRRFDNWSHQRAVQAIDHLVRIGTDDAIYALITLALGGAGARRDAAYSALDILAKRRDLPDRETLFVRIYPQAATASVVATQRTWLEHLMLAGVRIPAADFKRHVADNPVRRPFASTLLWAECTRERVGRPFRIGDGYEPQDTVGLVHPAELSPEDLANFRRAYASTKQVILQLERPVFYLTAETAKLTKLTRFAKRRVGFSALENVLVQRGWTTESDEYMHATAGWTKYCPRDKAQAFAKLDDAFSSIDEVEVEVTHHMHALRFADLHVVTISELLWDLETAHSGAPNPARVPAKAPPIVVERAKSGRSKCVVCTNGIAKNAPRLGVERMIETPSFSGRGTVWLHPECAPSVPELVGVDVAALLQDV